MDEHLIGYLLNNLDEVTAREVEAYLKRNPEGHRRLHLLRQALDPLAADREVFRPPDDLVIRTLALVAEHASQHLPRMAPTVLPASRPLPRMSWRRWDVFVTGGLVLTALLLAMPLLSSLRAQHGKVACQDNLRQYFVALEAFHKKHHQFPNIVADDRHQGAGLIAPVLQEEGVLPTNVSVVCPSQGQPTACSWTLPEILALSPDEFARQAPQIIPSYAYHLGYRLNGRYQPMKITPDQDTSATPLMADCPPLGRTGNSPNHQGQGQNLLFTDGHVRFSRTRTLGPQADDIYLNHHHQVAAGVDPWDIVLGPSGAHP